MAQWQHIERPGGVEQISRKTFLRPFRETQWIFCRPYLAILCVLPFFGCAALVPQSTGVRTIVTEPGGGLSLEASPIFGLVGRIAVKGSKESFSGGVQWRHTEGRDDILLLSPLGQALAQLSRTPEGVQLTTAERENYYASDMESLTEKVLGWRLPIMGLQYWVQGKNSPLTPSAIDLDDEGHVTAIRQDGWEILYSGYSSPGPVQTATPAAPVAGRARLLQLRRNGLQIKLVVDKWDQIDTGGLLN